MGSSEVDVSTHSILGTVSDFYHHQALQQETDKENDEITLKLPPIFQQKNSNNNNNNNNDENVKIRKCLDTPTIPSLFSPMSKKNRRKSNERDLIKGKEIEKEKENRKLQQLLKGDRVYATREERVLQKWKKQQKQWNNMKKSIAQKIGKNEDELVITRAEEWREMIEEIDLMTSSLPISAMSSSHWQHTLRKKTGFEETTHTVPIGNIFSGLYCKVKHNPRKPLKETVRKPRSNINTNEPGKGAASKHWKQRSITYQFRKKLHKKMKKLKPNNLDELDGLEIVGQNMFNCDKLQLPLYSYQKLSKQQQEENKSDEINVSIKTNVAIDNNDKSYNQSTKNQNMAIIGPSITFSPSNIISFNPLLYNEETKVLEIKNTGTTAILLRFENVEQKFKNYAIFLYPTEQFSILPKESKFISFYFKPLRPGSYHLIIPIETFPNIKQEIIELHGISIIEDQDKVNRDIFIKQFKSIQIKQDATNLLYDMINDIPEPDPKMKNLPKSFCIANRDYKLYWHPQIMEKLKNLSQKIIDKFRRRKRNKYKWDLSVSTLKIWLNELSDIHQQSIIDPLYDELVECIENAKKIPTPNPQYYDLLSTLITDLALQIPRFSWRSAQFAQISYKNEQQKQHDDEKHNEQDNQEDNQEDEQEEEEEEEEEESNTTSVEWNVFESSYYQNKLYHQCNQYLCCIINQFENSIINENEIDQSVINPIKSKLNPQPKQIITFGNWLNDASNSENSKMIKAIEILELNDYFIESIYSNSNMTIMTSKYKSFTCSSKQSLKEKEETQETTQEFDDNDQDDVDQDEKEYQLNDFKLLSIFKGFNVIQVFCSNDMINILTDTGDVYCSLFNDLLSNQTEVLYDKNVVKITGCAANNKCIAICESGQVFEWQVISQSQQLQQENTDKENIDEENTDKENKENDVEILKISEAKPLTHIDVNIRDIAMTSSAVAAITDDQKLIIWGDYENIYSQNMETIQDNKKKNNKSKQKNKQQAKKDDDDDNEDSNQQKAYLVIDSKQQKYKNIVSCLNSFIVLDENGDLYSFGNDEKYGSLGLGKEIYQILQPKLIEFKNEEENTDVGNMVKIKCISSWEYGCIAIDDKSNVWYWGKYFDNNKEEEILSFYSPTKVELDSKYCHITKAMVTNVGAFLWC